MGGRGSVISMDEVRVNLNLKGLGLTDERPVLAGELLSSVCKRTH